MTKQKPSITVNVGLTTFSTMDTSLDNFNELYHAHTPFPNVSSNYDTTTEDISFYNPCGDESERVICVILITQLVIPFLGAMGNAAVIWLLGFRIKRNPFSSYILNLAVADLGVLLSAILNASCALFKLTALILMVSFFLLLLTYSASQFLLTAISLDRCVAVFFPVWYQRKRPPCLPTIVSALIWILSILFTACAVWSSNSYPTIQEFYQLIVNAVLCLPVMIIATISLFIKACLKSQHQRRRRLLSVILLTLLIFLFFGFPLNVIYVLSVLNYVPKYVRFLAALLACLNSSVNPVIYFLVGRRWRSRRRENMKTILEKVFKEEENYNEETPI